MRRLAVLASTFALAASGSAQTSPAAPPTLTGVVQAGASVQRYSAGDDQAVRETSAPFGAAVRHRSGLGLSIRGVYASAGGDGLETLGGLADVQLGASYRRRLGGGAVEATLGASLPGRGSTLTDNEFATAAAIAFDDYAFDVPTLGQGATVSPGLTVVVPAGPRLALGAGAAYYVRSPFVPFAGDDVEYSPADETVLTGGLDAQIGGASTFALDVSFVTYGDDEFDGRTFSPGDRLAGTARWAWGGGLVRGRFLARYRHVFDGHVADDTEPVVYQRPSHAVVAAGLQLVQDGTGVELTAGARYYGVIRGAETTLDVLNVLGEQQVLVDLGVAPTVAVTRGARVRGVFTYTIGVAEAAGAPSLSGFRAGGGLDVEF
jgi:hypothetical protein